MAKAGEGFTGEAAEPPTVEPRKKTRKTADIRPGDVLTVPMTVVEVVMGPEDVMLMLADSTGNTYVVRRPADDSIEDVDRPAKPTIPFRGSNFAGGMSRGPV